MSYPSLSLGDGFVLRRRLSPEVVPVLGRAAMSWYLVGGGLLVSIFTDSDLDRANALIFLYSYHPASVPARSGFFSLPNSG